MNSRDWDCHINITTLLRVSQETEDQAMWDGRHSVIRWRRTGRQVTQAIGAQETASDFVATHPLISGEALSGRTTHGALASKNAFLAVQSFFRCQIHRCCSWLWMGEESVGEESVGEAWCEWNGIGAGGERGVRGADLGWMGCQGRTEREE